MMKSSYFFLPSALLLLLLFSTTFAHDKGQQACVCPCPCSSPSATHSFSSSLSPPVSSSHDSSSSSPPASSSHESSSLSPPSQSSSSFPSPPISSSSSMSPPLLSSHESSSSPPISSSQSPPPPPSPPISSSSSSPSPPLSSSHESSSSPPILSSHKSPSSSPPPPPSSSSPPIPSSPSSSSNSPAAPSSPSSSSPPASSSSSSNSSATPSSPSSSSPPVSSSSSSSSSSSEPKPISSPSSSSSTPISSSQSFSSPPISSSHESSSSSAPPISSSHESSSSSPPLSSSHESSPPPILSSSSSTSSNSSPSSSSSSLHANFKGAFSEVYAFGDSYTDTGNAKLMGALSSLFSGAHSPYGSTTFGKPSNRLCDGRLVIDFLCESLALPSLKPYKSASYASANFSSGVNFALAGSTSLSNDYFAKHKASFGHVWNMQPSMQTQIDWFNKFHQQHVCKGKDAASCKAELENALFWIGEMGINDYTSSFGSSLPIQKLTETCVFQIGQLLKTLLDSGAKYIVVQGLPPAGCLTSDVSLCPLKNLDKMGCVAIVNSAIMIHNQILQTKIAVFQKQYPEATIVYADYWNAYLTILMNPKKYQFEETFKACCGPQDGIFNYNSKSLCGSPGTTTCKDPSKYINWDGIHLTEAMHKHITELFLYQGFCHPSFDQLVKKKSSI